MKKMNDKFIPIYLQDAKRHIQWLYERIDAKDVKKSAVKSRNKTSFAVRFFNWLKRVF